MELYQPQEDTYLILEQVQKLSRGKVLEMGTGTGILAFEAQKNAKWVVALDINPDAVKFVGNLRILKKIKNMLVRDSNLFSFLKNNFVDYDKKRKQFKLTFDNKKNTKFDTIIFNPPYLPMHKGEEQSVDLYVSGGKYGYEIVEDFLNDVNEYLEPEGNVFLVFSSLTKQKKVEEIINNNLLEFEQLSSKKVFFEELYCYRIYKSNILKILEKKGITNLKRLTKGHRGWIFTGMYKGKKIVVKKQREDVAAITRVANEINFLKVLNKKGIGPKIIFSGKDYFVYKFISGAFIKDFVEVQGKEAIKQVFLDVFKLMYKLDKLKTNKEEMTRPRKHVIIDNKLKVHLIDFERATKTEKPKNVTQFVQYVCSLSEMLNKKKFKINIDKLRDASKVYKKDMSIKNYKKIINLI
ncbi:MAG: methyltransferase domain-containing protein [Nanoarchaeota archaeon]|nr:methyltransferase domain-containing protein [Nanoarchaeota archaeon]